MFVKPEVITDRTELESYMKWEIPDQEALKNFLINEKGFSEEKVSTGIKKLYACKNKVNQGRLDNFFKTTPQKSKPNTPQKTKSPINKFMKNRGGRGKR